MLLHFLNCLFIAMLSTLLVHNSMGEVRKKRSLNEPNLVDTVDAFFDTGFLEDLDHSFSNLRYIPESNHPKNFIDHNNNPSKTYALQETRHILSPKNVDDFAAYEIAPKPSKFDKDLQELNELIQLKKLTENVNGQNKNSGSKTRRDNSESFHNIILERHPDSIKSLSLNNKIDMDITPPSPIQKIERYSKYHRNRKSLKRLQRAPTLRPTLDKDKPKEFLIPVNEQPDSEPIMQVNSYVTEECTTTTTEKPTPPPVTTTVRSTTRKITLPTRRTTRCPPIRSTEKFTTRYFTRPTMKRLTTESKHLVTLIEETTPKPYTERVWPESIHHRDSRNLKSKRRDSDFKWMNNNQFLNKHINLKSDMKMINDFQQRLDDFKMPKQVSVLERPVMNFKPAEYNYQNLDTTTNKVTPKSIVIDKKPKHPSHDWTISKNPIFNRKYISDHSTMNKNNIKPKLTQKINNNKPINTPLKINKIDFDYEDFTTESNINMALYALENDLKNKKLSKRHLPSRKRRKKREEYSIQPILKQKPFTNEIHSLNDKLPKFPVENIVIYLNNKPYSFQPALNNHQLIQNDENHYKILDNTIARHHHETYVKDCPLCNLQQLKMRKVRKKPDRPMETIELYKAEDDSDKAKDKRMEKPPHKHKVTTDKTAAAAHPPLHEVSLSELTESVDDCCVTDSDSTTLPDDVTKRATHSKISDKHHRTSKKHYHHAIRKNEESDVKVQKQHHTTTEKHHVVMKENEGGESSTDKESQEKSTTEHAEGEAHESYHEDEENMTSEPHEDEENTACEHQENEKHTTSKHHEDNHEDEDEEKSKRHDEHHSDEERGSVKDLEHHHEHKKYSAAEHDDGEDEDEEHTTPEHLEDEEETTSENHEEQQEGDENHEDHHEDEENTTTSEYNEDDNDEHHDGEEHEPSEDNENHNEHEEHTTAEHHGEHHDTETQEPAEYHDNPHHEEESTTAEHQEGEEHESHQEDEEHTTSENNESDEHHEEEEQTTPEHNDEHHEEHHDDEENEPAEYNVNHNEEEEPTSTEHQEYEDEDEEPPTSEHDVDEEHTTSENHGEHHEGDEHHEDDEHHETQEDEEHTTSENHEDHDESDEHHEGHHEDDEHTTSENHEDHHEHHHEDEDEENITSENHENDDDEEHTTSENHHEDEDEEHTTSDNHEDHHEDEDEEHSTSENHEDDEHHEEINEDEEHTTSEHHEDDELNEEHTTLEQDSSHEENEPENNHEDESEAPTEPSTTEEEVTDDEVNASLTTDTRIPVTLDTKPIHLHLPTSAPNDTKEDGSIENYYLQQMFESTTADEDDNEVTLDEQAYTGMSEEDFGPVTEFSTTEDWTDQDEEIVTEDAENNIEETSESGEVTLADDLDSENETENDEVITDNPDENEVTEVFTEYSEETSETPESSVNDEDEVTEVVTENSEENSETPESSSVNDEDEVTEVTTENSEETSETPESSSANDEEENTETVTEQEVTTSEDSEDLKTTVTTKELSTKPHKNKPKPHEYKTTEKAIKSGTTTENSAIEELHLKNKDIHVSDSCTLQDYIDRNHCICSVKTMFKDLTDDLKDIKSIKSYQYDCHKFIRIEPGIVISNVSESIMRRRRRSQDFFMGFFIKHGSRVGRDIDSLLTKDLGIENTVNTTYIGEGAKVEIPCVSNNDGNENENDLTYSWTIKNGSPETGKKLDDGSTLIIDNATAQDSTNYTCTISTNRNVEKKKYHHQLSVVAIPMYSLTVTVVLNASSQCQPGDLEVLNLYYVVQLKDLLCNDNENVCRITVEKPQCIKLGSDEVISLHATLTTVPLQKMIPKLNVNMCDLTCQSKVYSMIVGILLKNLASVTNLPVIFRLNYRKAELTAIQYNKGDKTNSFSNSILTLCPAGFGIYDNPKLCFACEPHSYNSGNEMKCSPCPKWTFQPGAGSKSCLPCNSPFDDASCLLPAAAAELARKYYLIPIVTMIIIFSIILCCVYGSKYTLKKKKIKAKMYKNTSKSSRTSRSQSSSTSRRYGKRKTPPEPPPIDF